MDVAELILSARQRAGLSQRALAERAGTSAAAVCLYERAERVPRVDTLDRILRAAGEEMVLTSRSTTTVDVHRNGRDLWQVLAVADLLPQRHSQTLRAPRFAKLAVGERK